MMKNKIKSIWNNILISRHTTPILDITCIWLTSLCCILNCVAGKTELGLVWGLCAFIDAISLYFHLESEK